MVPLTLALIWSVALAVGRPIIRAAMAVAVVTKRFMASPLQRSLVNLIRISSTRSQVVGGRLVSGSVRFASCGSMPVSRISWTRRRARRRATSSLIITRSPDGNGGLAKGVVVGVRVWAGVVTKGGGGVAA